MKKLIGITLAVSALLIVIGCEGEGDGLEAPNVTYDVIDAGATLALEWDAVDGADGYYIYADGILIDSTTGTDYDATVPAGFYGVSAYAGEDESATDEVDCTPVETASITVYGNSDPDPDHPSGIGFASDGSCITLALSETTNHPLIDFYFDDANFVNLTIVSPGDHQPTPYNDEENTTAASGNDYDALEIAAEPGVGLYNTQRTLNNNAVLSFWIDPSPPNWGAVDDYFGKIKVVSITGTGPYMAVLNVAYQPIAGLRWVVTQ
ncbi:MAG: hypothetical protein OEV79_03205 [candidate division WOR-3 bacterium]|nr:hypothetical protein [candidate division WOR-3 bacterium]